MNDQRRGFRRVCNLHTSAEYPSLESVKETLMASPHTPARQVGTNISTPENLKDTGYPDVPDDSPGLVGGPATEAVPGSHAPHQGAITVSDDGGETTLSGRPRETGGARPQSAEVNT
jgi:hypothetical protein